MPLTLTSTTIEQNTIRCVIFANGDPPNPETAWRHANHADLLVAADGGAHHALALELVPHVVIGDLDSLDEEQQTRLRSAGTRFFVYPAAKDETDLELALLYAVPLLDRKLHQHARNLGLHLHSLDRLHEPSLANAHHHVPPFHLGRPGRIGLRPELHRDDRGAPANHHQWQRHRKYEDLPVPSHSLFPSLSRESVGVLPVSAPPGVRVPQAKQDSAFMP